MGRFRLHAAGELECLGSTRRDGAVCTQQVYFRRPLRLEPTIRRHTSCCLLLQALLLGDHCPMVPEHMRNLSHSVALEQEGWQERSLLTLPTLLTMAILPTWHHSQPTIVPLHTYYSYSHRLLVPTTAHGYHSLWQDRPSKCLTSAELWFAENGSWVITSGLALIVLAIINARRISKVVSK